MKKNRAIILLLATVLSSGLFGQSTIIVPIDGAIIVHQQGVPSEDIILLAKIDSVNTSVLKRTAKLDSAAKHHAMYLAKYYLDHNTVGHTEEVDYPNFEEKKGIGDRTGGKGKFRSAEICAIDWDRKPFFGTPDVESLRKEIGNNWLEPKNSALGKKNNFFFEGYKNSPRHWEILKDPEFKFYGAYTIFVCVYTKKGMDYYKELLRGAYTKDPRWETKEEIEKDVERAAGGDMHYVRYIINVTVFSSAE
jgi:hypothetical protein